MLQAELAVIIKLGGIGFPPGYKKTTSINRAKGSLKQQTIMRKFLLFIAALCCAAIAFADNVPTLDSLIRDDVKHGTKLKYVYKYNNQNLRIEEIILQWDAETSRWQNYYKIVNSYDANGDVISSIESRWSTEYQNWANYYKNECTYSGKGKLSVKTRFDWNTAGGWDNSSKEEYTYDNKGYLISYLKQIWEENSWQNNSIEVYTVDSKGNRTNQVFKYWDTNTNNWINSRESIYSYDANSNKTSEYIYYWDQSTNEWRNSDKYEYTYENNLLQTEIRSTWSTKVSPAQYIYYSKSEYSYDEHGNVITAVSFDWNTTIGAWSKRNKKEYTYDADNHQLTELISSWNSETGTWDEARLEEWTYAKEGVRLTFTTKYFNSDTQQFEILETYTYYYSGLGPQGIEQPTSDSSLKGRANKVVRDGQLLIERNGKTYNAQGAEVR